MENIIDQDKLIKKLEEHILDILEEESNSLEAYTELLEMNREDIFMKYYHLVRDNPENQDKYKMMMEEFIGGRPSAKIDIVDDIINRDHHEITMESDSKSKNMNSDIEEKMKSEKLKNELIYVLAAEEILYDN